MRFLATLLSGALLAACLDLSFPAPDTNLGSVKGAVVSNADQAPLADVEVKLVTATGSRLTQRTDGAGTFAFASVPPGVHAVEVRVETFAPEVLLGVTVARGKETDVGTLSLTPLAADATLLGKVVAEGGGPIDGARVELVAQATSQRVALTTVGPDGVFLQRLAPGTYTVRATHPLYASATRADVEVRKGTNDLTADPLSLALNPATLAGRVLRRVAMAGEDPALPQVLVTLASGQTTTTDAAGRFQLTGLAGGPTTARFTLANFVEAERAITLTPGQTTTLPDLTLEGRTGAIEGTVELSDQQPVQDVMVSVTGTTFSTLAVPDPVVQGRGHFRLEGVPNGTWEVTATRARYSRAIASGVTLTDLSPVATVGPLRLTLLVGDFRIDDGDSTSVDGYVRRPEVTLQLAAFSGADEYRASEDVQFADAGWLPFTGTSQPFTLGSAEGNHVVHAQYRRQGSESPKFQSAVVLDATGPTSESVIINAGAAFTNFGASLALELSAVDPTTSAPQVSGVGGMRVALSNATQALDAGVFLATPTLPWTREYTLGLQPRPDGPITVYAQFVDNAGNPSAIASSTIALDRLEPQQPTLRIRDGAGATATGYTNTPFVVLEHSADPDGGTVLLALANSSAGLAVATWGALTPTSAWVLDPSGPDLKTVHARFRDPAGNQTSPLSAQIVYDPNPPSPVSATVLSGTPTRDAGVTLLLAASDPHGLSPTAAVTVSEDPLFQGATPVPMPGTGLLVTQLSPGDGSKQLFVRFTDRAGNHATTSARVTLDTQAPQGALTVGNGAAVQTGATFAITLSDTSEDVTGLFVTAASAPDCDAVTYGAFTASSSLALAEGSRAVFACLRDAAGHRTRLGPVNVLVDNTPPVVGGLALGGLSNPGAQRTNLFGLTLQLSGLTDGAAGSGAVDVRVSTDPSFAGVGFAPANGGAVVSGTFNLAYTLPPGDGPRTVYVQVRDRAGLVSATVQATLTLDTQPPTWTSTGVAQLYVSATTGAFTLAAVDNLDPQAQLQVGTALTASGCASATLGAFNAALPTPALSAGGNTFYLCLADRAGNRPAVAPSAFVFRIAGAPLAANLVPNPPLPLASGALVSWTDSNAFTREVEIDASLDPTFATGVRTYRSATGTCAAAGVTPPPTSARIGLGAGELPLSNLRNWYLRLRAVDCAGGATANVPVLEADGSTPRPVTPNLSATPVGLDLPSARLFADGEDLWLHGLDPNLGREVLRTCRPSVADCRSAAAWRTFSVMLTAGVVLERSNRAVMFATDSTLFLVEVLRTGSGWTVGLASCLKSTDCGDAANWFVSGAPFLSNITALTAPVAGATSSTLGLFTIASNSNWAQPYLTMFRCDRSRGSQCRDVTGWTMVPTPIPLDPWKGLTLATNDSQFLVGGVSTGAYGSATTGPDGYGQPMLVKCEGLCAAAGTLPPNPWDLCTGGTSWPPDPNPPACGCDGYTCGDFRFSRLARPSTGDTLEATAPGFVATGGQVTAVWADRRCTGASCTDAVRSATCLSTDCQYGTDYTSAPPLAQWAPPGTNAQLPRAAAVISGGQEGNETIRAAYARASDGHTYLTSCQTGPAPCFATATTTRLTNVGETSPLELAASGSNFYAVGYRPLGEQFLWQPFVPSPARFVMGPTTTGFEVSWASSGSAQSTLVSHALPDGGAPATLSIADPLVTSVTLASSASRVASAAFSNANGRGDAARPFEAVPFRAVDGPAGTLADGRVLSLGAPGPGGNDYVYAAYVGTTGLWLGRCNTTGDCAQAANWAWNPVDTGVFSWVQLSVDYPRAFAFGSTLGAATHSTPRLFLTAGGFTDIFVYGCVLTTGTACNAAAQFSRFSLAPNNGEVGSLRAVGDRVSVALQKTLSSDAVFKYCDGSRSGLHDVCSGPGTTDRALDYCFNAANWKTVTLTGGPMSAAWGRLVAAPHPAWGWLAMTPRDDSGFVLWSCPFGTMASQCGAVENDCSNRANWRASRVDTDWPVSRLDLDFSVGGYHPTRGLSEQSAAVYVSWSSPGPGRWGVSQCKGAPSPHYGAAWPCVADDGSMSDNARFARAWSSTVVTPIPGFPSASTIRVLGGDVFAAFSTDERVTLARCSGGFDCMKRASWSVYSPAMMPVGDISQGLLTGGAGGELYVGGAVGTTPRVLGGGRFRSR